MGRWSLHVLNLDFGDIESTGQQVIHQAGGSGLPSFIIGEFLEQRCADSLRHSTDDLTIDDEWAHHFSTVLDYGVVQQPDQASFEIHLYDYTLCCIRVGAGFNVG